MTLESLDMRVVTESGVNHTEGVFANTEHLRDESAYEFDVRLTAGPGIEFPTTVRGHASYEYGAADHSTVVKYGFETVVPSGTREVRTTRHLDIPQEFLKSANIYASDGCTWQGEAGSPAHFIPLDTFFSRKHTHAMLHPGGGTDIPEGVGMAYDYFFLANPDYPNTYYLVATMPNFDAQERMEVRLRDTGLDITFVSDHEGAAIGPCNKDILIVQGESYEALGRVYRTEMAKRFTTPTSTLEAGFSWYTWGGSGRMPRELDTQLQQLWHLNNRLRHEGLQRVTKAILDDNFFGIREWGDFYTHDDEKAYLARFVDMCRQIDVNPCVWLAPLLAAEDSELAAAHPDWFLRDESGKFVIFPIKQPVMRHDDQPAFSPDNLKEQLFNRNVYVLDFSRKDVRDHIVSLFVRMQEMGVKGIKFDYGLAADIGGAYQDMSQTSKQHFRQLLSDITDACPGLELQMTSCRPSDVWGVAHSLRGNPDSSVPFEGLITNNVVGNLIRWLANDSPVAKNAQNALRAINSEHYFRSAFSAIVSGDMFEGLIEMVTDQIHMDLDRLKIDTEVADITHEQLMRYAKKIRVTLGDALQYVDGDMQERLILFLKRLDAVEAIRPVNLMKLMNEFSLSPLEKLSRLEKFFIWIFMPPSMGKA